jgi:protein-S-isoprenylcysteine O-methyltransferase
MTRRFVANLLAVTIIYLPPVVASPMHLAHPALWIAALGALVTLLSQPVLDLREAASRSAPDRGSALAIFGSMIAAQVTSAWEFAGRAVVPGELGWVGGTLAIVLGLALRLWAIRTLGRFFTATVRVAGDQRIVSTGPYRRLRHPSYTGVLVAALGSAAVLGSVWGLALVGALCVPAYLYRIAIEERALVRELGATYEAYRQRTWGLLPGLR